MKKIKELAAKYEVTEETIITLLEGLKLSHGTQVQFNISELGGMGQWQSGMVMVGDMFNYGLKDKVNRLCTELAGLIDLLKDEKKESDKSSERRSLASFKGSQNGVHYAYFASENLLEIEEDGKITKYDTTGYSLGGVQQSQQGNEKKLSFTYPGGTASVKDFKKL
jgi:hypothetical protein